MVLAKDAQKDRCLRGCFCERGDPPVGVSSLGRQFGQMRVQPNLAKRWLAQNSPWPTCCGVRVTSPKQLGCQHVEIFSLELASALNC